MELIDKKEIGQNIFNAFELVRETHRQIEKLLDAIDEVAVEFNEATSQAKLENLTKGFFLRFNSDKIRWGWMYSSFVKVFRFEQKPDIQYSIEINFDNNIMGEPMIYIGAHFYESGQAIKQFYPANGPIIMHRRDNAWGFNIQKQEDGFFISKPDTTAKREHSGLIAFKYELIPLLDIERKNIRSMLFDKFEKIVLN